MTQSHTEAPYLAEKSATGSSVRLGFSVWCMRSKHGECACSQVHPCALAIKANPS